MTDGTALVVAGVVGTGFADCDGVPAAPPGAWVVTGGTVGTADDEAPEDGGAGVAGAGVGAEVAGADGVGVLDVVELLEDGPSPLSLPHPARTALNSTAAEAPATNVEQLDLTRPTFD